MPLDTKAKFSLPKLPYAENALEPVVSAKTISFHYGKHHKAYVDKLNELIAGTPYESMTLEEIVRKSAGNDKDKAIFNNAGQAWNHNFYWQSLSPKGGKPSETLLRHIQTAFGGWDKFAKQLADVANNQFGSGWAWLVNRNGKLDIMATANAESPMAHGVPCLLTIDVWEHAYYIDYRNQREKYVEALINERLNWEFAERNFGG